MNVLRLPRTRKNGLATSDAGPTRTIQTSAIRVQHVSWLCLFAHGALTQTNTQHNPPSLPPLANHVYSRWFRTMPRLHGRILEEVRIHQHKRQHTQTTTLSSHAESQGRKNGMILHPQRYAHTNTHTHTPIAAWSGAGPPRPRPRPRPPSPAATTSAPPPPPRRPPRRWTRLPTSPPPPCHGRSRR